VPNRAVDLKLTLAVTQQQVLPENPQRVYALLVNDSAAVIYLAMGGPAEVNRGIRLNASGGSYEINLTNPWHGSIHAVATAGTPALLVQEW